MNAGVARHYRLSEQKGAGVHCSADGVFVGATPLLQRAAGSWQARPIESLSHSLSEEYGLPIDFAAKDAGLSSVARALNDGDIARAQIATLLMQLPEPLPLAKGVTSQEDISKLAFLLECAGLLKINTRHYPARTPGGKGGQFAPKDADDQPTSESQEQNDPADNLNFPDDPGREMPSPGRTAGEAVADAEAGAVRNAGVRALANADLKAAELTEIRLVARRLFRDAAVKTLERVGAKLALNEIPVVGVLADLATVYDVYRFAREFVELRAAIKAATRFVNEGTHTLTDLRVSSESMSFNNFNAFVKVSDGTTEESDLEKRFGPAGEGMQYHHIIERKAGVAASIVESTDNIVAIPTILHEELNARYSTKLARFGGKSLREWLQGKSVAVKREWGIRMMREVGIIVGE